MRWLMFFRIKLQYLACNEMEKKPEIKLLVYSQDTESMKETKYCCKWPWKSHQVSSLWWQSIWT